MHRIGVRKVASALGFSAKSGEEAQSVPVILDCLQSEAEAAGGVAPLPEPPDTTIIKELRNLTGNSQIVGVAKQADTVINFYKGWLAAGKAARERLPEWDRLVAIHTSCSRLASGRGSEPSDGSDSVPPYLAD